MKKYQIVELPKASNDAGQKAPLDVIKIAEKRGFERLNLPVNGEDKNIFFKVKRQVKYIFNWNKIYKKIPSDSIVLIQYPAQHRELQKNNVLKKLKKDKNVKFIFIIHDIDILRGHQIYTKGYLTFDLMVYLADKIIVHNQNMVDYMKKMGVSESKLINLKIFDYLRPDYKFQKSKFERSITIAGNLSIEKSAYLKYLNKIPCTFNLYGPEFSLKAYNNVNYGGVLSPDSIPTVLNKGFGLIWDGSSIDTCAGIHGKYLKYNNPHKLSLYLSSNLPVIIWSQAAESSFVKNNGVGILVDSLMDIPALLNSMTSDDYDTMLNNVKNVAIKLSMGDYLNAALSKALVDWESE